MTKDLAICVHGTNDVPRSSYLNTFEYMDSIAANLNKALGKWESKIWSEKLFIAFETKKY